MEFQYKARHRDGSLQEGKVSAADREGALSALLQNGLFVSHLAPAGGWLNLNAEIHFGGSLVKIGEVATFCGQFSALLKAGVPVLQSLTVLARQFKGRKLGSILEEVIKGIEGGNSLSQAMREHREALPPTLVYMTAVAEVSGRLDECYDLLARQFEKEDDFARKVNSALTYPRVVLAVAFAVILFMLSFVLPAYGDMFRQMGADLPASTRMLMAVGAFLKNYYYLVPVALGAVWLGARLLLRQPRIRRQWQYLLLKLPILGPLAYKREITGLCRTLGTMNQSGVPLLAALLTVASANDFLPMREALERVLEDLRAGESLGGALLRQPVFDRITVEVISLGEQAGSLDTMLFRVADIAEKDVNGLLVSFTAALEPMLTVVLGAIVVGILIPMLLPMFDILGQVR